MEIDEWEKRICDLRTKLKQCEKEAVELRNELEERSAVGEGSIALGIVKRLAKMARMEMKKAFTF